MKISLNTKFGRRVREKRERDEQRYIFPLLLTDTHKTTSVGTTSRNRESSTTHLQGENVGDLGLPHEGIKECLHRTRRLEGVEKQNKQKQELEGSLESFFTEISKSFKQDHFS